MSEDPYEIPLEDYNMIECMECGNSLADCICNLDDPEDDIEEDIGVE